MSEASEKLAGIPTEALLQEVSERSEFYVGLSMHNGPDGKRMISWRFKGDHDIATGLCDTLKIKIQDHKKKTLT